MTRQELLNLLLQSRFGGKQAALARAIHRSPAQVYQWVHGYRDIGHEMARHIETALRLPYGYMDGKTMAPTPVAPPQKEEESGWPFRFALDRFMALPENERKKIENYIEVTIEKHEFEHADAAVKNRRSA